MPKLEDFKIFLYCVDLLGQEFFFCICPLLGIHYEGAGSSSIYVIYSIALFAATMFYALRDLRKARKKINKRFFLFLPLIMTIIFFIEYAITPARGLEWTWKSYMFFMLFCMPAMYVGISLAINKEIRRLYANFDAVTIIIALGIIASIPVLLSTGVASLAGGDSNDSGDYNTVAYCSALSFGFIYYGILNKPQDRYKLFKGRLFVTISILFMVALAFTAFSSGGRGGSLLLIVLFIYLSMTKINRKNIFKVLLGSIPALIIITMTINYVLASNPLISAVYEHGAERAFQYISNEGIDTSKSSGRDKIYEEAIKSISNNPFAINGLFRTVGMRGYPHNFFIEILLDGGVVYFLFWIIYLFKMGVKYVKMKKADKVLKFLILIVLYTMVSTFFGGTYLMTGLFWFILAFINNYKIENTNYVKNKTVNIAE